MVLRSLYHQRANWRLSVREQAIEADFAVTTPNLSCTYTQLNRSIGWVGFRFCYAAPGFLPVKLAKSDPDLDGKTL